MAETFKVNGVKLNDGNMAEFIPPVPTESERGGLVAKSKGSKYTVEVQMGEDGKMYVPEYPKEEVIDPTLTKSGQSADSKVVGDRFVSVEKSVKDNFQSNTNAIDALRREKAAAIEETLEGTNVIAQDSSDDPFRGLTLYGKTEQKSYNGYQLFDASKLATKTAGGATVTNNGDGSFTVSGSGELTSNYVIRYELTHEETMSLIKAGRITINVEIATGVYFYVGFVNSTGSLFEITSRALANKYNTITESMLADETFYMRYGFYGYNGATIDAVTIKPMLYQDGDGTWEPFTGGIPSPNPDYPQELEDAGVLNEETGEKEIGVGVYGKNLLPYPYYETTKISNGITYTDMGNGGITVSGSATTYSSYTLYAGANIFRGKIRFLLLGTYTNIKLSVVLRDADEKELYNSTAGGNYMIIDFNNYLSCTFVVVIIKRSADNTVVTGTIYPMITSGDTIPTEYEPYKEPQTLIHTGSLPGIPLGTAIPDAIASSPAHMAGVWFREEDQQYYIGDTVDYASGKYVKRVQEVVFDKTVSISKNDENSNNDNYLYYVKITNKMPTNNVANRNVQCDRLISKTILQINSNNDIDASGIASSDNNVIYFNIGYLMAENTVTEVKRILAENPLTVHYILVTPIETDLPASEIAAYKALHTNYPVTQVSNDSGSNMIVEYNADTKTWILNQINTVAASIVSNL